MLPYSHQTVEEDDIAAVVAVLRGDWLTQGPTVAEFENQLARRVGAQHVVSFSSGTAALHAAASVAGLGPNDVVATGALSFVASASCALHTGAQVRFIDIDSSTLNIDLEAVPHDITALVAVHFAGLPLDLSCLTRRPKWIIEDAAHALGASTPSGNIGSCRYSDMCAFSFNAVKSITTGEGGAVSTNSTPIADQLRRFRAHGIARADDMPAWYYEVRSLGLNYRLTDLQAALGLSQLSKLQRFVSRRQTLANRYDRMLAGLPIQPAPAAPAGSAHARHLYPIRLHQRDRVYARLRELGIGVQVHYVPIHHHPLFRASATASLPATDLAYSELLSLPLYPRLTEADQDRVVRALEESL